MEKLKTICEVKKDSRNTKLYLSRSKSLIMQLTKKVKHKIGSLTLLFKATSPDYSISVFEMFDV